MTAGRAKGTRWETAIVTYLRDDCGVPHVERRARNGAKDRGDIAGILAVVIEAKAQRSMSLAEWVDEAEVERRNDGAAYGAVWIHRRGKASPADGYVVIPGWQWVQLLRDAGYLPKANPFEDVNDG